MKSTSEELAILLRQVFPDTDLPSDISHLGYGVIDEWDSLANYALLIMVEEHFNIRFSMQELSEVRTVKSLIERINER